jgi:hypothetical protein
MPTLLTGAVSTPAAISFPEGAQNQVLDFLVRNSLFPVALAPETGGQRRMAPMTSHEVHYQHRPNPEHRVSVPLLLGMVAVILIGILMLTSGI